MKTPDFHLSRNDIYLDVDCYVQDATGADWLFRVFKDTETGDICNDRKPRYSPNDHAPFDDGENADKCPPEAIAAFDAQVPAILALLNETK